MPAAAGVGRALAACFAAAGHDQILVSSDERDLRAMTADLMIRYRVRACPVAADVSDGDCYLERIASAANEMGGMDGGSSRLAPSPRPTTAPLISIGWPGSTESTTSRSCVLRPAFYRI